MTPAIEVRALRSTGFSLIADVALVLSPREHLIVNGLRVYGAPDRYGLTFPESRTANADRGPAVSLPKAWRADVVAAILARAERDGLARLAS